MTVSTNARVTTPIEEGRNAGLHTCAVAAVGNQGGVDRTTAVGRTDPDSGVEADVNTLFGVTSLTKTVVTITVALRLIEDNLLALSDDITSRVPRLEGTERWEATVQQPLTYGGIPAAPLPRKGLRRPPTDSRRPRACASIGPGKRTQFPELRPPHGDPPAGDRAVTGRPRRPAQVRSRGHDRRPDEAADGPAGEHGGYP